MQTHLRLARREDGKQIAAIYAPYCLETQTTFETEDPDIEDMEYLIDYISRRLPWVVCEHGDEILGYTYANTHRDIPAYKWCVETGIYVRGDMMRRGVGSALASAILKILALQGYVTACAAVALPNPASIGMHKSVGYRPVGTFRRSGYKRGQWYDVAWFEYMLRMPEDQPSNPTRLQSLPDPSLVDKALAGGLGHLKLRI